MMQLNLRPGEKILWSGRPKSGLLLRSNDLYLIPLSLLWTGFAFSWESTVLKTGAPLFMKIWGIPFVLVGIYITVGRFVYDALRRAATAYFVTNQAVAIICSFPASSSTVLNLASLWDIQLNEGAHGLGSITFGPSPQPSFWSWSFFQNTGPQFDTIEDARKVYGIINDAIQQHS
jgi:hypothetical protein